MKAGIKSFESDFDIHSDDTVQGPTGSGVRQKSGAARQNTFIGRLHMSMRTHHRAYAAIQMPRHPRLFGCDLGLDVRKNHLRMSFEFVNLLISYSKWV